MTKKDMVKKIKKVAKRIGQSEVARILGWQEIGRGRSGRDLDGAVVWAWVKHNVRDPKGWSKDEVSGVLRMLRAHTT